MGSLPSFKSSWTALRERGGGCCCGNVEAEAEEYVVAVAYLCNFLETTPVLMEELVVDFLAE